MNEPHTFGCGAFCLSAGRLFLDKVCLTVRQHLAHRMNGLYISLGWTCPSELFLTLVLVCRGVVYAIWRIAFYQLPGQYEGRSTVHYDQAGLMVKTELREVCKKCRGTLVLDYEIDYVPGLVLSVDRCLNCGFSTPLNGEGPHPIAFPSETDHRILR